MLTDRAAEVLQAAIEKGINLTAQQRGEAAILKNASSILQFRFYNEQGTLAAEGWQKVVFVDKQTMRPRRLDPEERSLFSLYVHSTVDAQPVNSLLSVP